MAHRCSPELNDALEAGRSAGLLGESVEKATAHAVAFSRFVDPPATVVDLGSGAGVPALVLAELWVDATFHLVEAQLKRAVHLERMVSMMGLNSRVTVHQRRAEDLGRSELRGIADVVTARCFAPPATTAELAAPLLRLGGTLVVSEIANPAGDRWPDLALKTLGLTGMPIAGPPAFHVCRLEAPCPERFPRRPRQIKANPLF